MRLGIYLVSVTKALTLPLLLNGQPFTNSLVALLALATAIGISLISYRDARGSSISRPLWRASVMALAALAVLFAAQLPGAYRARTKFNEAMRQARLGR